jgi:hypothetical protein
MIILKENLISQNITKYNMLKDVNIKEILYYKKIRCYLYLNLRFNFLILYHLLYKDVETFQMMKFVGHLQRECLMKRIYYLITFPIPSFYLYPVHICQYPQLLKIIHLIVN